jgi:hypothetical protein
VAQETSTVKSSIGSQLNGNLKEELLQRPRNLPKLYRIEQQVYSIVSNICHCSEKDRSSHRDAVKSTQRKCQVTRFTVFTKAV